MMKAATGFSFSIPFLYLYQCNVDSFLSNWETQISKLYKTQTCLLDGMKQYSEKKVLN